MSGRIAAGFGVALVAVLASCAPSPEDLPRTDPAGAGVTIAVTTCEFDPITTLVTTTFQVSSERTYRTVLLRGKVVDVQGAVLGEAPTSVSDVGPGQPREGRVQVALGHDPGGQLTCQVEMDLANPAF